MRLDTKHLFHMLLCFRSDWSRVPISLNELGLVGGLPDQLLPSLQSVGISIGERMGTGSLPQALFISFPSVLGDTGKVKTVPNGKEVRGS